MAQYPNSADGLMYNANAAADLFARHFLQNDPPSPSSLPNIPNPSQPSTTQQNQVTSSQPSSSFFSKNKVGQLLRRYVQNKNSFTIVTVVCFVLLGIAVFIYTKMYEKRRATGAPSQERAYQHHIDQQRDDEPTFENIQNDMIEQVRALEDSSGRDGVINTALLDARVPPIPPSVYRNMQLRRKAKILRLYDEATSPLQELTDTERHDRLVSASALLNDAEEDLALPSTLRHVAKLDIDDMRMLINTELLKYK